MSARSKKTMRVPYALSVHGKEEIDAVVRVLRSNTALGEKTKEFENKIAALFGKKYGCMVNSGSSANLLAFELLNLPKGSEVIPSLMGNIPDLPRLSKIAQKHKLYLIEDSCDTLGGTIDGKPTGAYSDISVTSFYGSHIINGAGGGGMICVNKPEWADRLVVLRGWGRRSSLFGEKADSEQLKNRFRSTIGGIPYDEKFVFSEIGYNFLPLELSAAFALEQLKKLPHFLEARKKNWIQFQQFFNTHDGFFNTAIQTPKTATAWLAFPVIIKQGTLFDRSTIVKYLEEHGIQTRPVFTGNILKQPGFERVPHRAPFGNYENTENIMRNAFVLGCHQGLSSQQIEYVQRTVSEFLSQYEKALKALNALRAAGKILGIPLASLIESFTNSDASTPRKHAMRF